MAVIEYDEYKQKLLALEPMLGELEKALGIPKYTEIKKRIELAEPGTVFLTSDFTDIATTTTVRKCLGRQVEEKNIRRDRKSVV